MTAGLAQEGKTQGLMSGRGTGVRNTYKALFEVSFRHGFYNASGEACPDFKVIPTPECAKMMASLGMVFADRGTGFGVFVAEARVAAMTEYLRTSRQGISNEGCRNWLTFLLVPNNSEFVGITSLPITTNPMIQNLHFDNTVTVATDGGFVFGGSEGPGKQALYPVTGASLTVPTPHGRKAVLADISGTHVPVATTVQANVTTFSLKSLPYGIYTVAFFSRTGRPVATKGVAGTYLYVPDQPRSLAVLDLLLEQPSPAIGDEGAYPVQWVEASNGAESQASAVLQPVALTLRFQSRGTYWRYYVVSQNHGGHWAPDLAISGDAISFTKSQEVLPNGDQAILFSAASALPLRQSSPYRFHLSGHREGGNGSRDEISIDRLPCAPAAPVWPGPAEEPLSGSSEIYVYV
ncbi:MAG: hypothetical protein P8Y58_17315 [Novosphingobium sp.]